MKQKITLAQLAEECHVAQSTIVKCAKKLGYHGFIDMYYQMCQESEEEQSFENNLIEGELHAAIADVLSGNPNFFMAVICMVCFAQAAVVFAIFLKTKDMKLKNIALPALVSALFSITEPAIYGVTLPRPKMFAISCVGGAIIGGLLGLFGCNYYLFAGDGLMVFPSYINPANPTQSLIMAVVAAVIGAGISFVAAFILYKDEPVK